MLAVLNKRWLSKGWRVMDKDDSELMALTWIEVLNRHEIAYEHYFELYQRSIELRVQMLNQGLQADDFSVDMMVACWPGLRKELRQREIDAGRTLTGQAQSQCTRCFNTGIEQIKDDKGNIIGAKPGCPHEFVEGETIPIVDMEESLKAVHRPHPDETDVQIFQRLKAQVTYGWTRAIPGSLESSDLWQVVVVLGHAEKYCRTIDSNLRVGGLAIADGITDLPVRILRLGNIFAAVEDVTTGYRWELMANRLQVKDESESGPSHPQVSEREGEELHSPESESSSSGPSGGTKQ